MFRMITGLAISAALMAGCVDNSPPPPRVSVPRDPGEGLVRATEPQKPMPGTGGYDRETPPPPAFDDVALIDQELPERRPFVAAYNNVGRPMLMIDPIVGDAEIDRDAAILMLTQWLRSGGEVTMIDPGSGRSQQADVLIKLAMRALGEADKPGAVSIRTQAVNAQDGVVLGTAVVEMPTPVDRQALNRYTRFIARKLMYEMTLTWNNAPPPARALEQPSTMPSR